jgi:hypothetical protein
MQFLVRFNKRISLKEIFIFIICISVIILWFIFLEKIHYRCPFEAILHIWCSGCGGTRMINSIIEGNFYQAFRYNPLLFILLIIGIIYFIFMIIVYIKKKVIVLPSKYVWIFIISLLIIYMILRNISYFSFLIPAEV